MPTKGFRIKPGRTEELTSDEALSIIAHGRRQAVLAMHAAAGAAGEDEQAFANACDVLIEEQFYRFAGFLSAFGGNFLTHTFSLPALEEPTERRNTMVVAIQNMDHYAEPLRALIEKIEAEELQEVPA